MNFLSAKLYKILLEELNTKESSKLVNLLPNRINEQKVPLKLENWIKKLLIDLSKYISLRKINIPYLEFQELEDMFNKGYNTKKAIDTIVSINEDSNSKKIKDFYQRSIIASDEQLNDLLRQLVDFNSQSDYKKSKDPRKKKLKTGIPRIHSGTIKDITISDREKGTVDTYKGIVDTNKKEFDLDKLRSLITKRYSSQDILKQNAKALKSDSENDVIWQIVKPKSDITNFIQDI